ncbi:ABC transporter ATP-binding protein/permease [Ursidibacter sp. B-7004-1]
MNNWQAELNSSFSWLCIALLCVSIGLYLAGLLLHRTHFGQKFWYVVQPCWQQSNKFKTVGLIILLLLMILLEVRISVLNTFFYNGLYSSLQKQQADAFWFFALINLMLVIVKIIHAIINYFLQQTFEIRWLEKLNAQMLTRWLENKNYYLIKYQKELPDNIDQRIEQDATEFVQGTLEAVRGVINAIVSTIEFTIILWGLSGILSLLGVDIPKGVVFFIYIFIIIATIFSVLIGRPLIRLNFLKEKLSGDYRYSLIRLRENAESIAFYSGEQKEQHNLQEKFSAVIHNRWNIVRRMLGLDGFNTGVTQIAMILPLMLQSQRFFAGQVTLGDMHQTVQSFNRLMRALSFFRLFYDEFTLYQARLNRLYGFFTTLEHLNTEEKAVATVDEHHLTVSNLTIQGIDGRTLLENVNFSLKSGDALLIQGASGTGKTTLLKVLAGIYPIKTTGHITAPSQQNALFLPQRSYVPQGTLKEAICYPNIQAEEHQVINVMNQCGLEKYNTMLNEEKDWQQILSPGELQRIAFVRILLTKPTLILLDETTSALEETMERQLYELVRQSLPESIIVSVGHRCTLQSYHTQTMTLGYCCMNKLECERA